MYTAHTAHTALRPYIKLLYLRGSIFSIFGVCEIGGTDEDLLLVPVTEESSTGFSSM